MPTVTNKPQSLLCFELTQDQIHHIACSLASDIGCAEHLMPKDFLAMHMMLLELFLSKLSEHQKSRVLGAVTLSGVLQ